MTFSTSFKSLMNLNKTFNIFSLLYSLFHILMTKTNYDQLENFTRIEKKIEKSSVNPIAAFDHKTLQNKSKAKKIKSPSTEF